jgi:hypothetical protein
MPVPACAALFPLGAINSMGYSMDMMRSLKYGLVGDSWHDLKINYHP